MLRLDVLREQWVILALFSGVVMVIVWFLFYWAMWRERSDDGTAPQTDSRGRRVSLKRETFMPWILILAFLSVIVYGAIFTVYLINHPPNW